jgi:hypothetical protein
MKAFSGAFSKAFHATAPKKPICPMQAQAALLAGAAWALSAEGLDIGGCVLVGLSGRPMKFRSEQTAAAYVETVVIRAAGEAGCVAALPEWARAKWAARKVESLNAYAGRVWNAAARLANESPERAALEQEARAAEARAHLIGG